MIGTRLRSGALLLARAIYRALQQLSVPFFMLLIMLFCFACIMFEIEWDPRVERCAKLWIDAGITRDFLVARPEGVQWTCDVCNHGALLNVTASECELDVTPSDCLERMQLCLSCTGHPPGHPECNGCHFMQRFPDIPRAMWFMMVTVTTVGYGDVAPQTWRGQLFACIVIVCGVIFIAMPIAIVGRTFVATWDEREVVRLHAKLRQLLSKRGIGADGVARAFRRNDTDGQNGLSSQEFLAFCNEVLPGKLHPDEIQQLWKSLDRHDSGQVSFDELTDACFPGRRDAKSFKKIKHLADHLTDDKRGENNMSSFKLHKRALDAIANGEKGQDSLQQRMEQLETSVGSIKDDVATLTKLLLSQNGFARRSSFGSMFSSNHVGDVRHSQGRPRTGSFSSNLVGYMRQGQGRPRAGSFMQDMENSREDVSKSAPPKRQSSSSTTSTTCVRHEGASSQLES